MQAHRHGTPMLASSGYVAQVDADLCAACGSAPILASSRRFPWMTDSPASMLPPAWAAVCASPTVRRKPSPCCATRPKASRWRSRSSSPALPSPHSVEKESESLQQSKPELCHTSWDSWGLSGTALGLVTILDHFPISRYNVPVTRRSGFVSSRPKTVLNKPKRPDPTGLDVLYGLSLSGCQL